MWLIAISAKRINPLLFFIVCIFSLMFFDDSSFFLLLVEINFSRTISFENRLWSEKKNRKNSTLHYSSTFTAKRKIHGFTDNLAAMCLRLTACAGLAMLSLLWKRKRFISLKFNKTLLCSYIIKAVSQSYFDCWTTIHSQFSINSVII